MDKVARKVPGCQICDTLRPLADHLYEMAMFCTYLENSATYSDADGARKVHTLVIGNWLRLASQLESVEINAWKYAGDDGLWCSSAADRYNIDSEIYTKYSTALTRFIYIGYALEETYRFVSHNYSELVSKRRGNNTKRIRTCSVQSAFLIDKLTDGDLPNHFQHIINNLNFYFDQYYRCYVPTMTGLSGVSKNDFSYGLHLIRNLRNHIAHGMFPLMNEFIDPDDSPEIYNLINLLHHASRSATIYMQALVKKYCTKFKSHEYNAIDGAYGEEFDYFLNNCTMSYALSLHMQGDFSLHRWMDIKN